MSAAGPRHTAREYALRILYGDDVLRASGEAGFMTSAPNWWESDDRLHISPEIEKFTRDLVTTVRTRLEEIDGTIRQQAHHWRLERMPMVDRNILRLSLAELLLESRPPARVILNEAIEMAKCYGNEDSAKFVNGILDPLARKLPRKRESHKTQADTKADIETE